MKKVMILLLVSLMLLFTSGCENNVNITATTSIVGKIANVGNGDIIVKAYIQYGTDMKVHEIVVGIDGYFEIKLPESGTYFLTIENVEDGKVEIFDNPISIEKVNLNEIRVEKNEITDVGLIFKSADDLMETAIFAISQEL